MIARRKLLIDHVTAIEAIEDEETRKANKGGHGHMHGSIMSHQPQSQTQKHRPKHSVSNSSASVHIPSGRAGGGNNGRSGSVSSDIYANSNSIREPTSPQQSATAVEERRRQTSSRSKSISMINDISQLVGADGMLAIFNAAGLLPSPHGVTVTGGSDRKHTAGMIFQHTEVDEEDENEAHGTTTDDQRHTLYKSHSLSHLPSNFPMVPQRKLSQASASVRNRPISSAESRLEGPNSFAAYLGFTAPAAAAVGGGKDANQSSSLEETARPRSADPYSSGPAGIASSHEEDAVHPQSTCYIGDHAMVNSYPRSRANRPHTANAAVRSAGPSPLELEEAEQRRAQLEHEKHKALRKEQMHAQTLKDKRRLCRSASNAYGLPKDIFRGVKDDVGTKIGLKFLRAMSANPSIYDDIEVKKRSSSGHGRTRAPKSNMW